MTISERISTRLQMIMENRDDQSWKDPHSPNYDRQWAEDALYHTIGPLTDSPKWAAAWTSESEPVPGFSPNGPAPRWTPEEVVMAFAGDPKYLHGGSGNPRSPRYGNKGGAPLYRLAMRTARQYSRGTNKAFIEDLYSNGFVPLLRMMRPGFDESRSPFISYVMHSIKGAVQHGTGGSKEGISAVSSEKGLKYAIHEEDPDKIREMADRVKGKYQTEKSHDKNPDNPYGIYSSRFYQVLSSYATALESGDNDKIQTAKNKIQELIDTIADESIAIRGASTGAGQAISTADRVSSIGVSSIDVEKGGGSDGEGKEGSLAGNIAAKSDTPWVDAESINYILKIALQHDIGSAIKNLPRHQEMAVQFGAKRESNGSINIGGKLTANELRYTIRSLGPIAKNYYGSGKMRTAVHIPRDAVNWWKQGEDTEIEPIPVKGPESAGGIWKSIWKRSGFQQMGPTEIAEEMTKEVLEFQHLGIPTARSIKSKVSGRGGEGSKTKQEAVSKVSVNNTFQSALLKLKMIAYIHRSNMGMDIEESIILRANNPLLAESVVNFDDIDCGLVVESCEYIIQRIQRLLTNSYFQ